MKIANKILIFIAYCLPEIKYRFSYETMQDAFQQTYKTPYSLGTFRKEFSNLKRDGYITHKRRYNKPIPALSRKGRIKITAHLPYKKYGHWDNKWRLVIFSIPETERKYRLLLQQKLGDLGFQHIQRGVYISPYPLFGTINRISTELGIRQYLMLVVSKKIDREQVAIQKIWNLAEINKQYRHFIKIARKIKRNNFWPLKAKQLEQEFYQIYKKDPHLPKELLTKEWVGEKAYKLYKEIVHSY